MALEGKYAQITGSSRGIGKGIAVALAENGVKVAVHYFQNEDVAKETSLMSAEVLPGIQIG